MDVRRGEVRPLVKPGTQVIDLEIDDRQQDELNQEIGDLEPPGAPEIRGFEVHRLAFCSIMSTAPPRKMAVEVRYRMKGRVSRIPRLKSSKCRKVLR